MNYNSIKVTCIEEKNKSTLPLILAEEEPLSIRVEGKPYSVIMRTPGKEKEHAAGLCLAEGIIDEIKDITSIGLCDGDNSNIVTITLSKSRRSKILNILGQKTHISNTSCGICGKEILYDIINKIKPLKDNSKIKINEIISNVAKITDYQPIRRKTRATHCSVIYDKKSIFMSSAEDVGRHNALDKSIGTILLNNSLKRGHIITLSSRVSFELVQKAARARIPIIAAISRPTSLAVKIAIKLNITLVTLSQKNGLLVYCNPHRIVI